MKEDITIYTIFISIVLFFALFIYVIGYVIPKVKCNATYESYNPSFTMLGGCKIEWNGKQTPVEIIREINQ